MTSCGRYSQKKERNQQTVGVKSVSGKGDVATLWSGGHWLFLHCSALEHEVKNDIEKAGK